MRAFSTQTLLTLLLSCGVFQVSALLAAENVRIEVRAERTIGKVSPYMTGACLEDVNHEVYGGIDSQMIFGESFQEPAPAIAPRNFTAYGGDWAIAHDELSASAGDGPKLLLGGTKMTAGEVSIDILFPDKAAGNAGFILKVNQPGVGADRFTGYEISLDTSGALVLGRHRRNWEPLRNVACAVPTNQWINLAVRFTATTLEASVDGRSLLKFEDKDHPLPAGEIGLRTWQRTARFRHLQIGEADADGKTKRRDIAFEPSVAERSGRVSRMWQPVSRGDAQGIWAIESTDPFAGTQCQRITFSSGSGEVGIKNKGLNRWGMSFVPGKPYDGYLWVRPKKPTPIFAVLESADGSEIFAEKKLAAPVGGWTRVDFELTPESKTAIASPDGRLAGRFAIKLKGPGSVDIGYAFLQPGAWGRFKNLPVRADVAQGLLAGGFSMLRYGGSMVNSEEYRWKKMIGPRERRPPYKGTWYPYSSNGWGIIDFLNFCEAAGFLAVPDLNVNETPHDISDFIEYVNGPVNTEWGSRRAADGHPTPYGLKYIELGNEEVVDDIYWQYFRPLAEAIWLTDPSVIPVVGDFAYAERITDPFNFKGAPRITSLAAHQKILDFAKEKQHPVWFDVHIWNDKPHDAPPYIAALGDLNKALAKISPGADFKTCVFEENSGNHAVRRALAHAEVIGGLSRLGVDVPIVCCANCLQCDKQNDNDWNQGLLFLNPAKTWGQPPYYVTQMIAANQLPRCVEAKVIDAPNGPPSLDVTARTSANGRLLTLQVANFGDVPQTVAIELSGFISTRPTRVTELSGKLDDVNTAEQPERIKPQDKSGLIGAIAGKKFHYNFAPRSFTVICWEGEREKSQ